MKKFFSVILVCVIIFSTKCFAYYDPDYDPYENNPNYIYVTTGGQGVFCLYKPSVDVQEYNPPHYQIAGNFIHYSSLFEKDHTTNIHMTLRYNWYTKETFHLEDGYWKKIEIDETKAAMAAIHNRRFADALFNVAYKMDFYGY